MKNSFLNIISMISLYIFKKFVEELWNYEMFRLI